VTDGLSRVSRNVRHLSICPAPWWPKSNAVFQQIAIESIYFILMHNVGLCKYGELVSLENLQDVKASALSICLNVNHQCTISEFSILF